jgi:hypothetical protein
VAAIALPLVGFRCGGDPEVILKDVAQGLHYVGSNSNPGAFQDLAVGVAEAIDRGSSIKATLDRVASSDDPFGEALSTAVCSGLESYAAQVSANGDSVIPPDTQNWEAYLESEVSRQLPGELASKVHDRVSQFNNAANLASINPRLAQTYARECVLQ